MNRPAKSKKLTLRIRGRLLPTLLVFFFILSQIQPSVFAEPAPRDPSEWLDQTIETFVDQETPEGYEEPQLPADPSADFFMDSPIRDRHSEEQIVMSSIGSSPRNDSEYDDARSFEDAIQELVPDYAAAVIVDTLSEENLKTLTQLTIEVGIAVIEKKIVLFTSGSGEEIRINPVAEELLKSADLIAHTHPAGHVPLPGIQDISLAAGEEYVVSKDGIYAYDSEGYINIEAYDYEYLAEKIAALHDPEASSQETRNILNEFIVAIDSDNHHKKDSSLFRSGNVTIFPNKPALASFDSTVPPANISVSDLDDPDNLGPDVSVIRVDYDTTNGSFGGAVLNFFGSPADLSGLSKLSFDLRTDNNTVSNCPVISAANCIKIEVKDIFNKAAIIYRSGLTSSFQQFDLTQAEILAAKSDLDLTQIQEIVFVVEHFRVSNQNNGFLEIRTGGLFRPSQGEIQGEAYDPSLHTVPAAGVALEAFDGRVDSSHPTGKGRILQTSSSTFRFDYNLNGGPTAFAFANMTLDQFLDFSGDFVLGLKGPEGRPITVKIEVLDAQAVKATFFAHLTENFQNFTLNFSGPNTPVNFDPTQIANLIFVVDRNLTNFNFVNTFEAAIQGLGYVPPVITGQSYDASLHTLIQQPNGLVAGGGRGDFETHPTGKGKFVQTSRQESEFHYNVNGGPTAFSFFAWTYEGWIPFGGEAVFGLKGPSTGMPVNLKVEFVDDQGLRAVFIAELTEVWQNFTFNLTGDNVPDGFDGAQITEIVFVMDRPLANFNFNNSVSIQTRDLDFAPFAAAGTYDNAILTKMPVKPRWVTGNGALDVHPTGKVNLNVTSREDATLSFNMNGGPTAFAFATMEFDRNVSLPEDLIFAVQGPSTGRPVDLKIEVQDSAGLKAKYRLDLTGALQNFTLNLIGNNVPAGFNRNEILRIVFVMDRQLGNFNFVHDIQIQTKGLDFSPEIGGSDFNESSVTELPGTPAVSSIGGAKTIFDKWSFFRHGQPSANEAEFEFFHRHETSFATMSFQGPAPMNLDPLVTLGLRGSQGSQVIVKFIDANGRESSYKANLENVYKNFTFDLDGVHTEAGFDRTQVSEIRFLSNRTVAPFNHMDLIQVYVKGLEFSEPVLDPALVAFKEELIQKGLSYFQIGTGIDPVTHFPYDRSDAQGIFSTDNQFTQPTLIGFYAQMLGDAAAGEFAMNGMSIDAVIAELEALIDSLLQVQADHGWNGLMTWFDLDPALAPTNAIGLGDNANLAQSLAVMIGKLESSGFTAPQQTEVDQIISKAEQFLDLQEPGYLAFVDPGTGLFQAEYRIDSDTFNHFMDRLNTEFRGAIAFLKVRYPSLPVSVWENMRLQKTIMPYQNQNFEPLWNLASFEGGAFQTFWPLLKNNEMDFIGFRNILHNHFITQADYAAKNFIPGFLSASDIPEFDYYGRTGVPGMAESYDQLIEDAGSTYALASAYAVHPEMVLTWLKAIRDQLPAINGPYGLLDSAMSKDRIAQRYFGIDIASTVIGLTAKGPDAFETYLKNRDFEQAFNNLYQRANWIGVTKTVLDVALPPAFPDRVVSVFREFQSSGTISNIVVQPTEVFGIPFTYASLDGGFGGRFWVLPGPVEAAGSHLIIDYTAKILPNKLKVELKDGADQLIYEAAVDLFDGQSFRTLDFALPDDPAFNTVQKVFLVAEDGDAGDFFIHSINFLQFSSTQGLFPNANLDTDDVSTVPGSPTAENFSSNPAGSSITFVTPDLIRIGYDHTTPGFTGFSINFDPGTTGASVDLTGQTLVFGASSDGADQLKLEIEDINGDRAIFYVLNVNPSLQYYEFLTSLASGIDVTQVKRINYLVDEQSIIPGGEIGSFEIEFKGI